MVESGIALWSNMNNSKQFDLKKVSSDVNELHTKSVRQKGCSGSYHLSILSLLDL